MDVGLLRQDMDKLHSRVTEKEQKVGQTEEHDTWALVLFRFMFVSYCMTLPISITVLGCLLLPHNLYCFL